MSLSKPLLKETKTPCSAQALRSYPSNSKGLSLDTRTCHPLPEPRASRKTVLKVKCFSEASLNGSKGALFSWCKTRDRFQEDIHLLPLGLSLWKLSRRRVRFSSLLTLMLELPNLSAMADL